MFDEGISASGDLLDMAVVDEVIAKSGAWFSYKSTRLGQGRENVKTFLKGNPDLAAEVRQAVLEKRSVNAQPVKSAQSAEAETNEE
jgi:recombination protein RecA